MVACSVTSIVDEIAKNGPVTAAISIYEDFDRFWKTEPKKVMTESGPAPPGGHAVVIVGWGTSSDGVDYWKVQVCPLTLTPIHGMRQRPHPAPAVKRLRVHDSF